MEQEIQTNLLKVFIENARLIPESEQSDLPREKLEAVSGKTGLWIEVVCPEGSCSLEKDKISLPAGGVIPEETKGIWLSVTVHGVEMNNVPQGPRGVSVYRVL